MKGRRDQKIDERNPCAEKITTNQLSFFLVIQEAYKLSVGEKSEK